MLPASFFLPQLRPGSSPKCKTLEKFYRRRLMYYSWSSERKGLAGMPKQLKSVGTNQFFMQ